MRLARQSPAVLFALAMSIAAGTGISCGNATEPPRTGGIRVLFIGNSLTYVNDLPRTLSALARSVNDTINVEMVASGGYALIDHYNGGSDALSQIALGNWDYVVLQQGPSSTPINRDSLVLTAQLFNTRIRQVGAVPALYMVWPSTDRFAFFDEVRISYQMAATAVNGVFLPAGSAWKTAWATDPSLKFYHEDGLHASPLGTYVAALVIYERLTGHDARSLPARAVVNGVTLETPEASVRLLQRAAHETNALFPR